MWYEWEMGEVSQSFCGWEKEEREQSGKDGMLGEREEEKSTLVGWKLSLFLFFYFLHFQSVGVEKYVVDARKNDKK